MRKWILLLFVLFGTWAWAQEPGGGHESGGIPTTVYYQALNFFALLAVLFFFLKKRIGTHFEKRHEVLTTALTESRRAKEEAEKKHQEYSVRLRDLEKEASQTLENIRREGEEVKRRLVEEARRLAENIELDAKRTAENEVAKARTHLYEETVTQVLEGARALLKKTVVETDQRRLNKEFVEKIEAVQ